MAAHRHPYPDGAFDIAQLRHGPWMDLRHDGHIVCVDGTNALSGTYILTAVGFTTHIRATTLAGYCGHDPRRLATIAALRALTSLSAEVPNGVPVSAHLGNQQLVLNVPRYELTFRSPEPVPDL